MSQIASPVPTTSASTSPAQPQQPAPASSTGTITCPLNGEQIPPCCCPVKN